MEVELAEVAEHGDNLAESNLVGAASAADFEDGDVGTEISKFQPSSAGEKHVVKTKFSGAPETELDKAATAEGVEKKVAGVLKRNFDAKFGEASGPGGIFQTSALSRDRSDFMSRCFKERDSAFPAREMPACYVTCLVHVSLSLRNTFHDLRQYHQCRLPLTELSIDFISVLITLLTVSHVTCS